MDSAIRLAVGASVPPDQRSSHPGASAYRRV